MATSVKNILVGAADLFISNGSGSSRPSTSSASLNTLFGGATGDGAREKLSASTAWREVGYTNNGLNISYEPNYGEVMVDQLLDAARLFKQSLRVVLTTELTEGTLENLQLSWGQMDTYYSADGSTTTTLAQTTPVSGEQGATLNMAAGALGDAPVERSFAAVGNAPFQQGRSVTSAGSVITGNTSNLREKERVYIARRVVSIDTTAHALKRDSATVFPVTFRCLPDDSYAGAEYGVVIDRVWGSN